MVRWILYYSCLNCSSSNGIPSTLFLLYVGEIPLSICRLVKLSHLCLGKNSISGNIPNCIHELKELKSLLLYNNELNGEMIEIFVYALFKIYVM
jgi:hypothetical protein